MCAADSAGVWLLRDTSPTASDALLLALRGCPERALVSVVLSARTARGREPIGDALRMHASATHCRLALAETRGVAVRWLDGIVSGTVEDVAEFLAAAAPVLDRARGHAELTPAG